MAVKMGEFLGILINITNKQTNQAYSEDDFRNQFKNLNVIGLIGVSERKQPGKNFIKIFDPLNDHYLNTGMGDLHWEDEKNLLLFESEKTIWEFKIRDVKRSIMQ